jgi:hypothetical protein
LSNTLSPRDLMKRESVRAVAHGGAVQPKTFCSAHGETEAGPPRSHAQRT